VSHDPHYEPAPICPNCGGDRSATFVCAGCVRDLCYNCHDNGKSHHCADCGWAEQYCLACCELIGEDWACRKHAASAREAVEEADSEPNVSATQGYACGELREEYEAEEKESLK
jgi:hypothetical protein